MPKQCAVRGCKVGQISDRNHRKRTRKRHPSLFRAPKCPIQREKWVEALGQNVKETDSVCAGHFREEDIKKGETFNVQGITSTIPFIRWSLKVNAVPVGADYHIQERDHNLAEDEDCGDNNIDDKIDVNGDENCCKDTVTESQEILRDDTNFLELNNVIKHFTMCMPERWLYMLKLPDILLIFLDETLNKLIQLRITPELSIVASFRERPEVDLNVEIQSMEDLYSTMGEVEKFPICYGTGVDTRYASTCVGLIEMNELTGQTNRFRCDDCSRLRRRLITTD